MSPEEESNDAQSWRSSYVLLRDPLGDCDERKGKCCAGSTVIGHSASPGRRANAAPAFVQLLPRLLSRPGSSSARLLLPKRRLSQRVQRPKLRNKIRRGRW